MCEGPHVLLFSSVSPGGAERGAEEVRVTPEAGEETVSDPRSPPPPSPHPRCFSISTVDWEGVPPR